jgi:hypothetical protein
MKQKNRFLLPGILILLLYCWTGYIPAQADSKPGTSTTVILIRHVERDNFFMVTPEGHERAKALVDAVGEMGISAIFSPDLKRNLDTVKPLARHLGIEITRIPRINKPTVNKLVDDMLSGHSGEVVLLVGNGSANLRALHQRLGGTGDGPYSYGDLFIYTIIDSKPVKLVKTRYGK